MKLVLAAVLAAALLVGTTIAQSSTVAAAEPEAAAEVQGGMCVGMPRIPFVGDMAKSGCKLPVPIGAKCSFPCSANKAVSFDSLPSPSATCTEKGWVVENPCRKVCIGAPDAGLLDKTRGVWPSTCNDHTLTSSSCKAICYHGGFAIATCGEDGKWSTEIEGECKPNPRLAKPAPVPAPAPTPAKAPITPAPAPKQAPQQQQHKPEQHKPVPHPPVKPSPAPAAIAQPTQPQKPAAQAPAPAKPQPQQQQKPQAPQPQQQQKPQQPQQQQKAQAPHQQQKQQQAPAPVATPVNLIGAVVDGAMSGGSPSFQAVKSVNYFDPGRVLVRPPKFMQMQVLNENGNTGIVIDPKLTEFGAFIGSRDYQLGQFVDLDKDSVTVSYAYTGGRTCIEAAAVVLRSPAFANRKATKTIDEFEGKFELHGKPNVALKQNELTVWLPALCISKAADAKLVVKLA